MNENYNYLTERNPLNQRYFYPKNDSDYTHQFQKNNEMHNSFSQNNYNRDYSYNSNQNNKSRYEENNNLTYQRYLNENNKPATFEKEMNDFKKYGRFLENTEYIKKFLLILITIFHISKVKYFDNFKIYILLLLVVEIKIYFHFILFSSKRENIISKNKINFHKFEKEKKIKREVDFYINKYGNKDIGFNIFEIGYGLISDLSLIIFLNIIGLISNSN